MKKYIKHAIDPNDDQQKQIYEAIKKDSPTQIKMEPIQLSSSKESVMTETYLPLSVLQIDAINDQIKNDKKTTFSLTLCKTELKNLNNNEKIGGFEIIFV